MNVRTCAAVGVLAVAGGFTAIDAEQSVGLDQLAIVADGVYTAAQAERGLEVYRAHCSYCHHDDLLGGEDLEVIPPALVGASFRERWYGESLGEMLRGIAATMPWQAKALMPQDYADVVSYMLKENGYSAGGEELPSDPALVDHVLITEER